MEGDGLYTRAYFTHIDAEGQASKSFLLPQKNPLKFYGDSEYSYNIPEFITGKVGVGGLKMASAVKEKTATDVLYKESDTCPTPRPGKNKNLE